MAESLEALESALADYSSQIRLAVELCEGRIHEGRNRPIDEREMDHWRKADVFRQAIRDLFKQRIPLAKVKKMLIEVQNRSLAMPQEREEWTDALLKKHGYD